MKRERVPSLCEYIVFNEVINRMQEDKLCELMLKVVPKLSLENTKRLLSSVEHREGRLRYAQCERRMESFMQNLLSLASQNQLVHNVMTRIGKYSHNYQPIFEWYDLNIQIRFRSAREISLTCATLYSRFEISFFLKYGGNWCDNLDTLVDDTYHIDDVYIRDEHKAAAQSFGMWVLNNLNAITKLYQDMWNIE